MTKSLVDLLRELQVLEVRGDMNIQVNGISYDSRRVKEGDLFVAIKGTRQDGGQFILDAIRRGASAVVSESAPENGLPVALVRVGDSRKALAKLAVGFFEEPSSSIQMIGVTGTNGKTTTTLLLESILKHAGSRPGVIGTLGYRWAGESIKASMTTPECLDLQQILYRMRQDMVSHVVMEVSSHALALGRIDGCSFRAGVFTNLSQDHLDFHKTMEEYFEAKARLFSDHLGSGSAASAAVINADDPYGMRLAERTMADPWTYSTSSRKALVCVESCQLTSAGISAVLATPSGNIRIRSPLLGRLNLYNVLAAAAAALALGVPTDFICAGLESLEFVDGRLQNVAIPSEAGFQVVVDYAHTPDAMEKSLKCLKEMTIGRLLVVFGCGGDRDRGKRSLMGEVAARFGDIVILTSDNPRSEAPGSIIEDIEPGVRRDGFPFLAPDNTLQPESGYTIEIDRRRAIQIALSWAQPGDMVFIGGKGHETYQIIGDTVLPFDDRVAVRDYFQSAVSASHKKVRGE